MATQGTGRGPHAQGCRGLQQQQQQQHCMQQAPGRADDPQRCGGAARPADAQVSTSPEAGCQGRGPRGAIRRSRHHKQAAGACGLRAWAPSTKPDAPPRSRPRDEGGRPRGAGGRSQGRGRTLLGPGLARVPPATRRHQESRLRGRHPDSRAAVPGLPARPGRKRRKREEGRDEGERGGLGRG